MQAAMRSTQASTGFIRACLTCEHGKASLMASSIGRWCTLRRSTRAAGRSENRSVICTNWSASSCPAATSPPCLTKQRRQSTSMTFWPNRGSCRRWPIKSENYRTVKIKAREKSARLTLQVRSPKNTDRAAAASVRPPLIFRLCQAEEAEAGVLT